MNDPKLFDLDLPATPFDMLNIGGGKNGHRLARGEFDGNLVVHKNPSASGAEVLTFETGKIDVADCTWLFYFLTFWF